MSFIRSVLYPRFHCQPYPNECGLLYFVVLPFLSLLQEFDMVDTTCTVEGGKMDYTKTPCKVESSSGPTQNVLEPTTNTQTKFATPHAFKTPKAPGEYKYRTIPTNSSLVTDVWTEWCRFELHMTTRWLCLSNTLCVVIHTIYCYGPFYHAFVTYIMPVYIYIMPIWM